MHFFSVTFWWSDIFEVRNGTNNGLEKQENDYDWLLPDLLSVAQETRNRKMQDLVSNKTNIRIRIKIIWSWSELHYMNVKILILSWKLCLFSCFLLCEFFKLMFASHLENTLFAWYCKSYKIFTSVMVLRTEIYSF